MFLEGGTAAQNSEVNVKQIEDTTAAELLVFLKATLYNEEKYGESNEDGSEPEVQGKLRRWIGELETALPVETELSPGWNSEIRRETEPGSGEFVPVTEQDEMVRVVVAWLAPTVSADFNWTEWVRNDAWGEDGPAAWEIPLTLDYLAELAAGELYLAEMVEVDGVRYTVTVDLTDH